MKAQPGPMVSGSHFFPKAPVLWVKWMTAWAVTSRKVMVCAWAKLATSSKGNIHHRDTEAQRKADKTFFLKACITFGPRKTRWRGLLPGFARLGRARRPSPHPFWACFRLGGLLGRVCRSAAGLTRARGYSAVHCCLPD